MRSRDPVDRPQGLVLAAGAGRRFGSPKQLAELAGQPLLEYALAAMAAAGLARVVVVLGSRSDAVVSGVDLHGAEPVLCPRWGEGQSASLRAGVEALGDSRAVVVTLGDQPLITAAAIDRVAGSRRPGASAVRATYSGRPGHPVLLEPALLARVPALRGDTGARALIGDAEAVSVPCDDVADPTDVDTPARLADLASSLRSGGPRAAGAARGPRRAEA